MVFAVFVEEWDKAYTHKRYGLVRNDFNVNKLECEIYKAQTCDIWGQETIH